MRQRTVFLVQSPMRQRQPHARRTLTERVTARTHRGERVGQIFDGVSPAPRDHLTCAKRDLDECDKPRIAGTRGDFDALRGVTLRQFQVAGETVRARQTPHRLGTRTTHGNLIAECDSIFVAPKRVFEIRANLVRVSQAQMSDDCNKWRVELRAERNAFLSGRKSGVGITLYRIDQRKH